MKKKVLTFVFLIVMMTSNAHAKDKIIVFAGAGMRKPLVEAGEIFESRFDVEVVYDFEGSGRLSGKIVAGQKPDVFIPGSMKWADQLKEDGYVSGYEKIAKHIPVIITPKGESKVKGLSDFSCKDINLVLGDARACAIGRVEKKIFEKAGLSEEEMNVKARGATVKQLLQWIEFGNGDASIVWLADARESGNVSIIDIPAEFNNISAIPVCSMCDAPLQEKAKLYIEYLLTEGKEIFRKCGFEVF